MLGAMFILVTLLLPKGIVGRFNAWWEPWKSQARQWRRGKPPRLRTASAQPNPAIERMNIMDTLATSAMLYLRRRARLVRTVFSRINNLSRARAPARSRHHRPHGAGKTTMMDIITADQGR